MSDRKWMVRNSGDLVRSPRLSDTAADCLTPHRVEVSPYYVLEAPEIVHVLATSGDHVVLVRPYLHSGGIWSLELPGGVIDTGEIDPIAVGRRELTEGNRLHRR